MADGQQDLPMTSMERVLTTLGHQEPDRVPLFLLVTMHGAKELGLSIKEYFSKAEYVVEGQLRMLEKYRHDCLYPFFYAAIEPEAFGSETIWFEDGPPNSGAPVISSEHDIRSLQVPDIENSCLNRVLETTRALKKEVGDRVPIIGVVISPFSLPVMQMGFPAYIELMYDQPALFQQLMEVNQEFCVRWANAQVEAGATAICYFDPLTSPTITAPGEHLQKGFAIAQQTLGRIQSPTAFHLASGKTLSVVDEVLAAGSAALGVSTSEDLEEVKAVCKGRITVLGNLNGVEMRRWTPQQAKEKVREAIQKAGAGGGFILSDNHGEIPWQVSEEVLLALSEAVHQWGTYPLTDC
ncbi:MAG: uroporphyrinogen decarboxylase family protein [Candidatus Electrothrix aestuarii]|uniref:Uroporphyrinogen decarboxylase family protein n=1 Tax=Candidatus Electrothrix aestuarii TaxID=3062594 RepID=A0AAU8LQA8_9BACT|nr:uroporphyrinogen decarboxylase family protein [Candidatus Electrothrix aestuarii]